MSIKRTGSSSASSSRRTSSSKATSSTKKSTSSKPAPKAGGSKPARDRAQVSSEARGKKATPGADTLSKNLGANFATPVNQPASGAQPHQPFSSPGSVRDHSINAVGGAADGVGIRPNAPAPATPAAAAPAAPATPAPAAPPPAAPAPERPVPRSEDMRRVAAAQSATDAVDGPGPRPARAAAPATPPSPAPAAPEVPAVPPRSANLLRTAGKVVSGGSAAVGLGLGVAEVHGHLTDQSISAPERRHRAWGAGASAVGGTVAAVGAGALAAGALATAPAWVPIVAGGAAAVAAGYAVGEGARWAADRASRFFSR